MHMALHQPVFNGHIRRRSLTSYESNYYCLRILSDYDMLVLLPVPPLTPMLIRCNKIVAIERTLTNLLSYLWPSRWMHWYPNVPAGQSLFSELVEQKLIDSCSCRYCASFHVCRAKCLHSTDVSDNHHSCVAENQSACISTGQEIRGDFSEERAQLSRAYFSRCRPGKISVLFFWMTSNRHLSHHVFSLFTCRTQKLRQEWIVCGS